MQMNDTLYMKRCLELARLGEYYVAPNPMVGAVLVAPDGHIVSEGWHERFGGPHAEVVCLGSLEDGASAYSLEECTLYVNLEPCSHYGKTPPCAKMLIEKGIGHVVVGMQDPNPMVAGKGIQMLREAGIDVKVGVLEDECRFLNRRFLCLQEQHRPYVILKWAQTEDGFLDKLRIKNEELRIKSEGPLVISSKATKQLVHKMRAENMAIMVGTQTAIADNPKLLTTRWPGRNPIRIVPDRRHRIPKESNIFSDDAPTIVYEKQTDWDFIVQDLGQRGIHSVLVEGGKRLLDHILQSGIYDEIHVEVAPVTIGEGVPAPAIPLPTQPKMVIDGHLLYEIYHRL